MTALMPVPAMAVIRDRVIGLDVAANVPTRGLDQDTSTQFGAFVRYEHKLRPAVALTARGGWFRGTRNASGWAQDFFGIWGGGVYRFAGQPDGLFASAELGLNSVSQQSGNTAWQVKGDGYPLGGSAGVGYRSDALSFRASLVSIDLSRASDTLGLMFSAGWDFTAL